MENLSEERVLRYLLGELSENEQLILEERFITDSEFHTLLCEVEEDLIADYVRGRLNPHDRQKFEEHFLPTWGQGERVRIARVFLPLVDRAATLLEGSDPIRNRSFWKRVSSMPILRGTIGVLARFVALLLALGGIWLIGESRRLSNEVEAVRLESRRSENELLQQIADETRRNLHLADEVEQLRERLIPLTSAPDNQRIVKHVLVAETLRDDNARATPRLIIPPATEKVQLVYKMEDSGYPSYRAELHTSAGEKIWSSERLNPKLSRSVATFTVTLPASEFDDGSYTLSVSGVSQSGSVDPLGKPTFQVKKR